MKKRKNKNSHRNFICDPPGLFNGPLAFVLYPLLSLNLVYSFFSVFSFLLFLPWKFCRTWQFSADYLQNDTFPIMIRNNVYYCVISLIVQVGFGTFLAFLLESRLASDRFKSICRNIYFLPALVSLTAVGMMFNFIYNPQLGLLNTFLKHVGLASMQQTWLGDKTWLSSVSLQWASGSSPATLPC